MGMNNVVRSGISRILVLNLASNLAAIPVVFATFANFITIKIISFTFPLKQILV